MTTTQTTRTYQTEDLNAFAQLGMGAMQHACSPTQEAPVLRIASGEYGATLYMVCPTCRSDMGVAVPFLPVE